MRRLDVKITLLEMRRNPGKIVEAIERNETVTLSKRGKDIARIVPLARTASKLSLRDDPAVGIWDDRSDMTNPTAYVRNARKPRHGAV